MSSVAQRLAGKIALISGAASGIGAGIARVFVREGATVVVGDVQEELGRKVVSALSNDGGNALFVPLDVTSADSWGSSIDKVVSQFGGLTTLVNNAGIFHAGGIEKETTAGWQKMIAVNQTGVFLGMKAAMPALLKSGNAAVLNISSLWGLRGSPDAITYHAVKGAVRVMSKAAALEFARRRVRVNTIFPGVIRTPIQADVPAEQLDALTAAIPVGEMGDPGDIAHGALYLCSDEARYVTGAELVIDGGCNAQ
jgi:NAD(P)-dependent dehydrogenase (short-subunit alcohol dehydrogenase family)